MSARATRPRSRRGRHAPPGELDPVAESSEEGEVAGGSSGPSPAPAPGSSGPQQLGPAVEVGGRGPGNRASREAEENGDGSPAPAPEGPQLLRGDARQDPEGAAPQDRSAVHPGCGDPDVFQTLQRALASLEAAAAAWRLEPLSSPGPGEAAGGVEGTPGPRQEVARLAEKNAWLRLALDTREDELAHTRAESDTLRLEVRELQDSLQRLQSALPPSHSRSDAGSGLDGEADGEPWATQHPAHPLLRRLHSDPSAHTLGPCQQPPGPDTHVLEGQEEQLRGSVEKLKGFNRLLLAALQGSKGRCEGLSMQLGRLEAEATALRLALQFSEDCEEAYGALLALREASATARGGDLQVAQEEARRLLAREEAAVDGGAPQPSPEDSSEAAVTAQEVAARLHAYLRRLQEHRALVKLPPEPDSTLAPRPTTAHAEAMVQAILEVQPGPARPRLGKTQIQQDLVATRETLADLALQLQLARREKRGLELREAALRAQAPALLLLLDQLRWEQAQLRAGPGASSSGGDSSAGDSSDEEETWPQGLASGADGGPECRRWDQEQLAQDLAASLSRAQGLREQLRSLRAQLEQVAQRGRAGRAQSAELSCELCRAHSALVLGFRGAHRKQEEQRRKLEKQMAQMEAQQAEELARLEATARAPGRPRPRPAPPLLGETLL
ncbi:PREDICTED: Usher syndrome type-1C protein-binding protein 1 isoform X2 [Chinchilla lanigera]|uniref:USH1 protein network component harmonin binding protein 1 n=1 Tax=Chinchilla lanigera TaxID=34839 RepID=A0A8C2V1S9_CHILA|nr:PREDICTED: Usher syndrome type-1C protein-binding protein 1 isoform X2 [Chinchilla lanigera]